MTVTVRSISISPQIPSIQRYIGNDHGYLFSLATSESLNTQYVFADFTANTTSGDVPLTVKFTDLSTGAIMWRWDVDGDGEIDYTVRDPTHTYYIEGTYNVTLTVIGSQGVDTRTEMGYINVDWNPWDNPESDGGESITSYELFECYNCWKNGTPVSGTGADVTTEDLFQVFTAWKS
jgi:PKD repeat protein